MIDALAGAGDLVGSIIGEILGASSREEADYLRRKALEEYNIELPPVEELQAQSVQSQAGGAQGSAEAKSHRLGVLRQLSQLGTDGYDDQDRAAMNNVFAEVDQNTRGRNEAMLSGVNPNSGAALAVRAGNAQQASMNANKRGLDVAADGRRRALQALSMRGNLAGDIDSDEFGQSFARGGATDAISQFNERNRMDASKFNVGQGQQRFQNQVGLANRRAEQYGIQADAKETEAQRKARIARGGGRATGAAAGAAFGGV